MKSIYIRIPVFLLFISAIFTSCEKVIDVDLNDSKPQLVMEAIIRNGEKCTLSITKTINFNQSNNFPVVDGAVVTLSDDAGNAENLQNTGNGQYISTTITGNIGRTYTLQINVDGNTFKAISSLPNQVNLDSVFVDSLSFLGGTTYTVTPQFVDPIGVLNFYRFKTFVNNEADKTIFIDDDVFSDGRTVTRPLFGELEIQPGDSIKVQMMCIDNPVYLYFFSLAQVQDGSTGAPANPVSNFTGGCLGYFSAQTIQERTIFVE